MFYSIIYSMFINSMNHMKPGRDHYHTIYKYFKIDYKTQFTTYILRKNINNYNNWTQKTNPRMMY